MVSDILQCSYSVDGLIEFLGVICEIIIALCLLY